MTFLTILENLKIEYKDNLLIRKNGTVLLNPGSIPNCKHMLFKGLTNEIVEEFLISDYKNFPKQYIKFLKYSNGANLCNVKLCRTIKKKKFEICGGLFTILGLPRTQPYGRPPEMEEPFDLRVENLRRHTDIPDTWLKCGTYTRNYDFHIENDIFIDTETEKVYACVQNQNVIVDSWDNLDECFCSIYRSFDDMKDEYDF